MLITGATGFAGSFLVEHYASEGWNVHGTYRDPLEDDSWLPQTASLHHVDLTDSVAVAGLVERVEPDLVQHLAAQSSVSVSLVDPMATFVENATMQFNLLEAVVGSRIRARVIIVGSCDEYGNVGRHENPVGESSELRPQNPYALSKVVQDLMGYQYAVSRDMDVVRVRPFLQIGPRRPDRFVAGSFARQIAEIELGLTEPVIRVGNIDLIRDFSDVRDVARAYAAAAQSGVSGQVFNIASGTAHSLRELLETMIHAAGVAVNIRQEATLQRQGEVPMLIGDATRLRHVSGWAPEISFEQSASDTLDYWRGRVRERAAMQGRIR